MINEQELRDIYYDPSKGYQSAEKLYQKAKADGVKVSRRLVKNGWKRKIPIRDLNLSFGNINS